MTQTWRAALMLALGIAVLVDAAAMWQLIVVAFLITAGEILVDPSIVAYVPQLVSPGDLDRANGRLNTVEMATNQFFGQTAGAVLYGLVPWLPFAIDAVTYGGSTAPLSRLPRSAEREPTERNIRAELAAGLNWIRGHRFLRPLTGSVSFFHLGTGGTIAMLVLLIEDTLEEPAWVFGVVLAIAGLGAALTSSVAARFAERTSRRTVLTFATVGVAATTLAAAGAASAWHVIVLWFFNGAAFGLFHSVGRGFVQRHTPDELIGRTSIAQRMLGRGAFAIGALIVGAIAEATSVRTGLAAAGAIHAIGAVMVWRAFVHEPTG